KVGQSYGAKDNTGIMTWSHSALSFSATVMFITAMTYTLIPGILLAFFTDDQSVIAASAKLLIFVALFQIPDGLQVTLYGILRGVGITKLPMIFAFVANWMIGIPCGYWLANSYGMGAAGYWAGLAIGLTIMCLCLGTLFYKKVKHI
ncbi:MAG: MATE family efflux transporter, partial [Bdellovibrionales bacterium CG22_combo_CG10-13_8_21_14_all_38_13]